MDGAEFEKSAIEHLDAVYRMALHLSRDHNTAEDLVQEVYARAMRPKTIARFEDNSSQGGGGMRAWLFAIVHNVFYSKVKREARQPSATEEFYGEAGREQMPGEAPPQWDGQPMDWEQVDGTLKSAVADLKPEYRQVLLMWGVEGLKYREIAEILEVPIGTVMSRLHRARKLLADQLKSDDAAVEALGLKTSEQGA